jgi:hypothetical protein
MLHITCKSSPPTCKSEFSGLICFANFHSGETDGFDVYGDNNYIHDVSVENGDECVCAHSS